MTDHIRIETNNRLVTVAFSRPDKKNAITQDMYQAMADAVNAYAADEENRALMIKGDGDYFTSGNDLRDFATAPADHDIPPVVQFLHAIKDCPKPLIAAVNGPAIGVGLTLTLHCDLVFASSNATFSAPFVKLGLVPEAASSLLLPEVIGTAAANDVFMTGRTLTAQEALAMGLVSRVIDESEFADAAAAIARSVAESAPNAMKHTKALVRDKNSAITERMASEGRIFSDQLKSSEFSESIAAMSEKRAAVYA
ncbi:enoyl-CoA hydratase-related protein [Erythrobacter rubeus]|uniref:Enoyl-CoA hydratase/isomerase family protein n=1 Tax=Erythrobacter rubeus TaxID=2760803 RepID=A0ABR8KNK8_9SPHN|nr:enoyl-CoA hydratase-related protein [Erythrobacter rubeus]MBD2840862.1 enoyl-CoA hydratase/isomerase family protein [Erythrobacter rubeus]